VSQKAWGHSSARRAGGMPASASEISRRHARRRARSFFPTYAQALGGKSVPIDVGNIRFTNDIRFAYHPDAAKIARVRSLMDWLTEVFRRRNIPGLRTSSSIHGTCRPPRRASRAFVVRKPRSPKKFERRAEPLSRHENPNRLRKADPLLKGKAHNLFEKCRIFNALPRPRSRTTASFFLRRVAWRD